MDSQVQAVAWNSVGFAALMVALGGVAFAAIPGSDEIFTEVDATTPCAGGLRGNVAYFVDGVERVRFGIGQGTLPFQFSLFEPGATTPHTLTMTAREQCGVQLTINSVKVDVLGFS